MFVYRTKLTDVVNKCNKKVRVKMLVALVEHNVHVQVLNVHI